MLDFLQINLIYGRFIQFYSINKVININYESEWIAKYFTMAILSQNRP